MPEAVEDAELTDVAFANANAGVVVGERGALWRTVDGGRTWTRSIAPTGVRLESVSMINETDAWAVGGYAVPTEIGPSSTVRSQGIVLRTKDGGLTWQSLHQPQLPALTRVKFFTRNQGVAVGASSSLFASSLFQTTDGGRSWNPMQLVARESWIDGDFASMDLGCVLGQQGRPHSLMRNTLEGATDISLGAQRPMRIRFGRSGAAWLVGERGLVRTSLDGGRSWMAPRFPLGNNLSTCDWQTVATFGENVWIAGSPGSVVLHSPDSGKTWKKYSTGSTVPLRGLFFFDESRGWAVGGLGTILHTSDGGKTWQVQRSGGKRLAVLALFPSARHVPWEAFAQLAATDGYRTGVELVTREDEAKRQPLSMRQRMTQAAAVVGVAATDEYGIVPLLGEDQAITPDDIVKTWNELSDRKAISDLEERMVRAIRQWRPDIVITSAANPRSLDPVSSCINKIVLSAASKSGDPAAYSDHLSRLGLEAWKPKRVFASHGQSQRAAIEIHRAQVSPKMLSSLAELADQSRGLVGDDSPLAKTIGFDLLHDETASPPKMRDFFAGMTLLPGSDARRQATTTVENVSKAANQVQRRIHAQAMVDLAIENPSRGGSWLAHIDEMTHGMSPSAGAGLLANAALRSARSGNREVAAEAFQTLIRKYPQTPHAEQALAWLVQYYGSAEAAWIYRGQKTYMLRSTTPRIDPNTARPNLSAIAQDKENGGGNAENTTTGNPVNDQEPGSFGVSLAGLNAAIELEMDDLVIPTSGTDPSDDRYAKRAEIALDAARSAQRISPALFATPSLQFALASAARQSERKWSAKPLQMLASAQGRDPWGETASCELWMAHRRGKPPKKVWSCAWTTSKPVLDGKLDDEVWKAAQAVALARRTNTNSNGNGDEKASAASAAVMMYDAEYLYLGVSCPRAEKREETPPGNARKHDSPMAARDRIELFLDVDRDYSTFFHLSIDSSGRNADTFWRDPHWDPTWYVASGGDDDYWTCECAIPWTELVGEAPTADQMWAVGIQRIIPGQALESWTSPASVEISPEGFGLLRFAKSE